MINQMYHPLYEIIWHESFEFCKNLLWRVNTGNNKRLILKNVLTYLMIYYYTNKLAYLFVFRVPLREGLHHRRVGEGDRPLHPFQTFERFGHVEVHAVPGIGRL